jgi:hypothetical protein
MKIKLSFYMILFILLICIEMNLNRESSVILLSRYRPDISRSAGVTTLNKMNLLMVTISPNSNQKESALRKSLIGFDHSIEIWLAEVARESQPLVLAKMNDSAKRRDGAQNVLQLVPIGYKRAQTDARLSRHPSDSFTLRGGPSRRGKVFSLSRGIIGSIARRSDHLRTDAQTSSELT